MLLLHDLGVGSHLFWRKDLSRFPIDCRPILDGFRDVGCRFHNIALENFPSKCQETVFFYVTLNHMNNDSLSRLELWKDRDFGTEDGDITVKLNGLNTACIIFYQV